MNPTGILERLAQIEHRFDIAMHEIREMVRQIARITDDVAQLKRHVEKPASEET